MTTIAYRDGVMASDSSGWMNDSTTLVPGWRRKVHRLADGTLFGGAGETGPVLKIRRWIEEGGMEEGTLPPGKPSAVYGFFVRPDGRLFVVQDGEVEEILDAPFYSCGSGSDAALGAMHMGATAEQAVEVAMRVDGGTAGRVVSERLGRWDGPRPRPAEQRPDRFPCVCVGEDGYYCANQRCGYRAPTALPEHVARARARWARAYEPWEEADDARLVEAARVVLGSGGNRLELCRVAERSPNAVDARLRRLGYPDLADRLAQCPG